MSETGLLPQRIGIMTMDGAEGLSARVVFNPGFEQSVLPGARRQPYVGLVLEAARLLYVSITRARAPCVVSRAKMRFVNASLQMQAPSKFAIQMGGPSLPEPQGSFLARCKPSWISVLSWAESLRDREPWRLASAAIFPGL
jgi:superfamily I DNA/RNA helicase